MSSERAGEVAAMRRRMTDAEWHHRMHDHPLEESAYALSLIIEQAAVCDPCKESDHENCTGEALDAPAGWKPTKCWCEDMRGVEHAQPTPSPAPTAPPQEQA